jgi:ABC-2 type transport system ATP-binding protein
MVTPNQPHQQTHPARREGNGAPDAAAIQTRKLRKVYRGGTAAVEDLELTVARGEVFGLLGPNGAGKTTTIGMLTTRVLPTSGEARVAGIDVVDEPARAKRLLGVVSQTNTLDRMLSVRENLYYHGRYFGLSAAQANAAASYLLDRFKLAEHADGDVSTLSGGLAQRVMLARAVLHRPAVLFLDEPTAGLDPQSRLALWELIAELRQQGHTVLLTTHSMEEADQLCDRVAIMDHGRILGLDTPTALKRTLGGDAELQVGIDGDAAAFADALGGKLGAAAGGPPRVSDHSVRVSVRSAPAHVLPAVLAAAQERRATLTNLALAEPTLESVLLNLTGRELRE